MATERTPLIGGQKADNSGSGGEDLGEGGYLNQYILRINRSDDHISSCTKRLIVLSVAVMLLWMSSFILVMVQIIEEHETPSHRLSPLDWPLFLPMWVGSGLGICGACHITFFICHNATLTSRERRAAMPSSLSSSSTRNYIDFDSLPLLRRLLGYLLSFGISLVLCLTTQILYYLWFIHSYFSVWHAVIPTFILLLFYTAYMYSMSVFDTWSCCTFSLFVLDLPLVTLQLDGFIHLPSTILLAPFVLGVSSCLVYYLTTLYQLLGGRLMASRQQCFCLFLYILSLALLLLPAVWLPMDSLLLAAEAFLLAVPLFTIPLAIVLYAQGMELAESRGYSKPMILIQDEEGAWVPAPHGNMISIWLLGSMQQDCFEVKETAHMEPNAKHKEDGSSVERQQKEDRRLRLSEIELTSHGKN
ncbi:hypothetical protein EON65_07830 [archaeon]|nr:MAG: hypothetical protein EON65_07830 [archaeon]